MKEIFIPKELFNIRKKDIFKQCEQKNVDFSMADVEMYLNECGTFFILEKDSNKYLDKLLTWKYFLQKDIYGIINSEKYSTEIIYEDDFLIDVAINNMVTFTYDKESSNVLDTVEITERFLDIDSDEEIVINLYNICKYKEDIYGILNL